MYCGDPTDLDLMFPQITAAAARPSYRPGAGSIWAVASSSFSRRLRRWQFHALGLRHRTKTLFSADGLSYGHDHEAGQCGQTAEEATPALDITGMTAMFSDAAFYWTRFTDVEPYVARLEEMIEDLDVQLICPAHGLPVTDLPASMPLVYEGMRMGARGELTVRMQHMGETVELRK